MAYAITDAVKDTRGVPVTDALVYVYAPDGTLASLYNELSAPLVNPIATDRNGVFSAFSQEEGFHTLKINYGGRERHVETVLLGRDPIDQAYGAAGAAEAFVGPTYANVSSGLAATAEGGFFAVAMNGLTTVYQKVGGASVYQRDALSAAALLAPAGAGRVGYDSAMPYAAGTVGSQIEILRDRYPTFEDFGAKGNGLDNDGPAIRAAVSASMMVAGLPGRIYRINDDQPILVSAHHTICGVGGAVETTTDEARPAGCKFLFTGSASACFANLNASAFLSHGTFQNFAVVAVPNYGAIFDLRNVLGMRWIDVWMEARGNNTAGLVSSKAPINNPSWVNFIHRCYWRLPDASTRYVLDHDWSDTSIAASYFTGGKCVIDRGYGARYTDCQFDRSSSAGLTVKKLTDTKGGAAVNCSFDANKEYGVVYDVNDDPSSNYDVGFQLVGNTFRTCDPNAEGTPGLGQVGYRNNRGQIYSAPAQRNSTFLFPKNQPTERFIDGPNSMWSLRTEVFGDIVLGRSGMPVIDINGTLRPGATDVRILAGNGSPEGLTDGGSSSTFHRRDGGNGSRLYIKTSSLGDLTGWVAIA